MWLSWIQVSTLRVSCKFLFMVSWKNFRVWKSLKSNDKSEEINFNFQLESCTESCEEREKNQHFAPTLACFLTSRWTWNNQFSLHAAYFFLIHQLLWNWSQSSIHFYNIHSSDCFVWQTFQIMPLLSMHYLTWGCLTHSSFTVWGLYETMQTNKLYLNKANK